MASDSASTFNRGRWQKGQSGNPQGRSLERTLADRLRHTSELPGFADVPFKNIMARFIWDAAISGQVELIGGQVMVFTPNEWLDLVKWLSTHVDGALHIQRFITTPDSAGLPSMLSDPAEPRIAESNTANDTNDTEANTDSQPTGGFIDSSRIA